MVAFLTFLASTLPSMIYPSQAFNFQNVKYWTITRSLFITHILAQNLALQFSLSLSCSVLRCFSSFPPDLLPPPVTPLNLSYLLPILRSVLQLGFQSLVYVLVIVFGLTDSTLFFFAFFLFLSGSILAEFWLFSWSFEGCCVSFSGSVWAFCKPLKFVLFSELWHCSTSYSHASLPTRCICAFRLICDLCMPSDGNIKFFVELVGLFYFILFLCGGVGRWVMSITSPSVYVTALCMF